MASDGCKLSRRLSIAAATTAALLLSVGTGSTAPAIRIVDTNRVPACVTPERLMAFVGQHDDHVELKYREIARWYQYWGEAWRVRWDYAFYQMILETNYLKFKRGNGAPGDVRAKQNNFAGIGATGGGVPGDRFPDVKTGVLAQIQHLVAYSGEHLAQPVAPRTQLKQDDIIQQSQRLRRAVTFSDLAHRWAADRQYGRSIDAVAELFRATYCLQTASVREQAAAPPPQRTAIRDKFKRFGGPSKLGGPKPASLAAPNNGLWQETQAATPAGEPSPSGIETMPRQIPDAAIPAPKSPPQVKAVKPATEPAVQEAPVEVAPQQTDGRQAPDVAPVEAKPARPKSPVRTIWSRDGAVKPETQHQPAPPALKAERSARSAGASSAIDASEAVSARPHAADIAPMPGPAVPSRAEPVADDAVQLPEFKIKPAVPAPQRLGGPVLTPAAPSARARFAKPVDAVAQSPTSSPPPPAAVNANAIAARPETLSPQNRMALSGPRPSSASLNCKILTASYGGNKTLLVRAATETETKLTALTVLDGFETSMFNTYARAHAPGAELVGTFDSRDDALAEAHALCPDH